MLLAETDVIFEGKAGAAVAGKLKGEVPCGCENWATLVVIGG